MKKLLFINLFLIAFCICGTFQTYGQSLNLPKFHFDTGIGLHNNDNHQSISKSFALVYYPIMARVNPDCIFEQGDAPFGLGMGTRIRIHPANIRDDISFSLIFSNYCRFFDENGLLSGLHFSVEQNISKRSRLNPQYSIDLLGKNFSFGIKVGYRFCFAVGYTWWFKNYAVKIHADVSSDWIVSPKKSHGQGSYDGCVDRDRSDCNFTAAEKQKIKSRDGYRCVWCGSGSNLEVDHICPCVCCGSDNISNGQTLCSECHDRKSRNDGSYDRSECGMYCPR